MKIHVVALVMVGMTEEAAGGTDAKSGGKEIPFKSSNSIMQMHILIRNSNMCRKGVDSSATAKETCRTRSEMSPWEVYMYAQRFDG